MQIKNPQLATIISLLILIFAGFICFRILDNDYIEDTYALEAPNYPQMVKDGKELDDLILAHHEYMNNFFNEKMNLLKTKNVSSDFDENGILKCTDESIATYCVAIKGSEELNIYLMTLTEYETKVNKPGDDTKSLQDYAHELTETQVSAINQEMDSSVKGFELALDLYDQYQKNYALHIEYKKIISSLEKYRDELIKIRTPSEYLPSEFINVTTEKCT